MSASLPGVGTRRLTLVTLLVGALLLALLPPASAQTANAVDVTLLVTNDFHGRIGTSDDPTAAYLKTQMDAVRDAADHSIYVDAGDLVGAAPVLSTLFYDEPTVEVMNLLDLDIQTVGNHEFDRGQDEILRRAEGGCLDDDCDYRGGDEFTGQDFETLAANVVDASGEPLMDPYAIRAFGDIEVGFIGVVTETTPEAVHPDGIEGLTFLDEAETVNQYVPELESQGVDAIVVLLHEGGVQDGDENSCEGFRGAAATVVDELDEGVDVVLSGHTHEGYVCDLEDGPLVTSAREYATLFTEVNLTVSPTAGVLDRGAVNHALDTEVTPDAEVVALLEHYEELAGPALAEGVGTSTVAIPRTTRLAESAQGNLATDALLDQFPDADFAFQNSGGLRADLTSDETDEDGNYVITRENVLEVWPFGNTVVMAEIDGTQLEAFLANGVAQIGGGRFIQVGGLRITYVIDETVDPEDNGGFPRGVIESVEYWGHPDHADGTPVDLTADATYTIATNDFMAVGGDGYPDLTDDIVFRGEGLELAVEAYLEDHSPVSPMVEGRIVGFPDVTSANVHREAILALAQQQVLLGRADAMYRPGWHITRGQFASVLARAAGLAPVGDGEFTDVDDSVHAGAINALAAAGLIQGYEDGTFRPQEPVSRQHVAALLTRWLDVDPVEDGPFTDVENSPYRGQINALAEIGVVEGTTATTFAPHRDMTRAQVASVVYRADALD